MSEQWQGASYETTKPESSAQQLLRLAQQSSAEEQAPPPPAAAPVAEPAQPVAQAPAPAPAALPALPSSQELMAPAEKIPLATEGWRARLAAWTFGAIKLGAGPKELARLRDQRDAALQLSRPMTIMVANPKGGVGKTPLSALLAAMLADARGGAVAAWDNNENQGTLGLRTEQGRFPTTTLDLLANLQQFENGQGRMGDLGRYVRHQQAGGFDVLASAEDSRQMTQIGAEEFQRIHQVLTTFYQLIVVDTGNALLAPNWAAAAEAADVLVVPVRWSHDHVVSAARMFDQLIASGREHLVRSAITVISHARDEYVDAKAAPAWRDWFSTTTAGVFEIPYDPHIAAGSTLRLDRLSTQTRRALLAVTAEVTRNLSTTDQPEISSMTSAVQPTTSKGTNS